MTDDPSSGEAQTGELQTGDLWLQSPAEATAALSSPLLVPPPQPANLAPGPTADLRSAMARFSAGDDHGERRRAVVDAIERLHPQAVADIAREETTSRLSVADPGGANAIADIALIVPTRRPLAKTVRVATAQTTILGRPIAPGRLIIVPLDSPGNEFGAGPHRCPGQELAAAVIAGIADSGYRVAADQVAYGDDGRPTAIPIEPIIEQKDHRS